MSLQAFRLFTRIFTFCIASSMALDCSAVPAIMTKTFNRAKSLMPKNVMATIFSISDIENAKKFFTPKKIVGSFAVALAIDGLSKLALKKYQDEYHYQIGELERHITQREARTKARIKRLEDTFNAELIQHGEYGATRPTKEAQQQYADEIATRQQKHQQQIDAIEKESATAIHQEREEIDSLLKKYRSLKNYGNKTHLLAAKLVGAFWGSAAFIAFFGSMRIRYGSPLYKLFRPILPTAAILFPDSPAAAA